jgi:hypothetical protein
VANKYIGGARRLKMIELYDIEEVRRAIGMEGFIFPCPNKCKGTVYVTSLLPEDRKDINSERVCERCGLRILETSDKIFIIDDEKWKGNIENS